MAVRTIGAAVDAKVVASAAFERTCEHRSMREARRKIADSARHGGKTELADRLAAESAEHGNRYEGALSVLAQVLDILGYDVRNPFTGLLDHSRAEAELDRWIREVKGS